MGMYAKVMRNHQGGGNEDAWRIVVFDGDQELASKLAYDHMLRGDLSFEDHMRIRLADLGFAAEDFELRSDGTGFRIENVHRVN